MVFFFFLIYFYLFIYFWLCWVFIAARGLSLVAASGGYSSLWWAGFSLRWLLLLWSTGSRHAASVVVTHGLSSCRSRALERRLSSCGARAWVAPRHVGSSQTRDRTRVPSIGRQILKHCVTREVPFLHSVLSLLPNKQRSKY